MKKFLAFLMAGVLLLSLSACKNGDENPQNPQSNNSGQQIKNEYVTLLYSTSDSFNPYEAITDQNRQLSKLLFEPLVSLDNEFNAVQVLAKNIVTEGTVCTVTLKNVTFSDGTPLTAGDVVYSYNIAKKSSSIYASKLYSVKSASATATDTVVFNLLKADPYFENLLIFPILKSGSDKILDADSVKQVPIGTGRYIFNDNKTELVRNLQYHGEKGSISKIRLINAPDGESISHYVEIGATDLYFNDISDGEIIRMSGEKQDINLNNLVYIGINHSVGDLNQSLLRQAFSSGINREAICSDAYYNNALSATGFFSPVWDAVKSVQNIQTLGNSQITIENLEEIGYNSLDAEGVRRNGGNSLRFTLLVNSENRSRVIAAELIASQLKEYGIKLSVIKVGFDKYKERLQSGDFQLYLGEVNITENMDISSLVIEGGSVAYGVKNTVYDVAEGEAPIANSADIIEAFYSSKAEITDVVSALQTEMPIIPVCYRTGVLFSKNGIKTGGSASQNNIYSNIY